MKKFFYLLLALPLVFAACQPESDPVAGDKVLAITSSLNMSFDAEGGEGVITYELKDATRSSAPLKVEATCAAQWISNLVVADDITFDVAANEGAARDAKVVVSYGEQKFEVAVAQNAKSLTQRTDITAEALAGQYYSPEQLGTSTYCYYFMLTDKPYTGEVVPNASYFLFSLFSDKFTDGTIPNGTYTLDLTNSAATGTIQEEESYGYKVNATGDEPAATYLYADAEVTVTDGKVVANITTTDGQNIVITYEGITKLAAYEGSQGGYSTLTGDLELNITDMQIEAANYADYYGTPDANNWFIEAMNAEGKYITLDLLADVKLANCGAEYHVLANESDYINSYIAGTTEDGYLLGCWYAEIDENGYVGDVMAPLVGGTIKIEVNGNKATITFNCVDDAGHKVTGAVSGSYTEVQPQ